MVAVAERPTVTGRPLAIPLSARPDGRAARALARSYLRHASAMWMGKEGTASFGRWLEGYRCLDMPQPPAGPP